MLSFKLKCCFPEFETLNFYCIPSGIFTSSLPIVLCKAILSSFWQYIYQAAVQPVLWDVTLSGAQSQIWSGVTRRAYEPAAAPFGGKKLALQRLL